MKIFIFVFILLNMVFNTSILFSQEDTIGSDYTIEYQESDEISSLPEYRTPNYLVSIGTRAGYIQTIDKVYQYFNGTFAGSVFTRINPFSSAINNEYLQRISLELEVSVIPFFVRNEEDSQLTVIGIGLGPRFMVYSYNFLSLNIFCNLGMMNNILNTHYDSFTLKEYFKTFLFKAGIELDFELAYHSSISLGTSYQTSFENPSVSGLIFTAGYNFQIGGEPREYDVEIQDIQVSTIIPAYHIRYKDVAPLAKVLLKNNGDSNVTEIKATLYIKGIIDSSANTIIIEKMEPGKSTLIPIYCDLNTTVFNETDSIDTGTIIIQYTINDTVYTKAETVSVTIHNKNILPFEDIQSLGTLIAPQNNTVQYLSHQLDNDSITRTSHYYGYINNTVSKTILAYEALKSLDLTCENESADTFLESEETQSLLFFQYPDELIQDDNKSGSQIDFLILYNSLLESLSIQTGYTLNNEKLITMINTEVPKESRSIISETDESVFIYQDTVWIPIDIAFLGREDGSFIKAWESGINEVSTDTRIVTVHDAWENYPPVQVLNDISYDLSFDQQSLIEQYSNRVNEYIEYNRKRLSNVVSLATESESRDDKLAQSIEFIRGMHYSEALNILNEMLLDQQQDFEFYYHLGVALLQSQTNLDEAIEHFYTAKSLLIQEDSPNYMARVYLNIALCYYYKEDYDRSLRFYNIARELDSTFSNRFTFLSGNANNEIEYSIYPLLLD